MDAFTEQRIKRFAPIFAELFHSHGPAAAGKAAREEFPGLRDNPELMAALRPHIRRSLEDLGYEFPDDEEDNE